MLEGDRVKVVAPFNETHPMNAQIGFFIRRELIGRIVFAVVGFGHNSQRLIPYNLCHKVAKNSR